MAGNSNGAAFAGLLVCDAPHTFAAVAMVIATTPSTCAPGVAPSSLSIRGTEDRTPQAERPGNSAASRSFPATETILDLFAGQSRGGAG